MDFTDAVMLFIPVFGGSSMGALMAVLMDRGPGGYARLGGVVLFARIRDVRWWAALNIGFLPAVPATLLFASEEPVAWGVIEQLVLTPVLFWSLTGAAVVTAKMLVRRRAGD